MKNIALNSLMFVMLTGCVFGQLPDNNNWYDLGTKLESRSISFENPKGEKGAGGKATSEIGMGRKGFPKRRIEPGETVVLCDIDGPGTIRHIWMTGSWQDFNSKGEPVGRGFLLRSTVIRAYWDGQEYPSIESPLGDLMGFAHGKATSYGSAVHSIGEKAALNLWIPMPFTKNAKLTITNESDEPFTLFYQIDYTMNDAHNADVGRLHVQFQRQNPTEMKKDFEILPKRTGRGRYLGTVLGVRTLSPGWWGEGEIKMFMDGDEEFPTICGTGTEDYVGLSYGIQNTTFQNLGCNLLYKSKDTINTISLETGKTEDMQREFISMYRWHIPDPIFWKEECRITIQQIGCCLYERSDDWSAATFWYEGIPSEPLKKLPSLDNRLSDLEELWSTKLGEK